MDKLEAPAGRRRTIGILVVATLVAAIVISLVERLIGTDAFLISASVLVTVILVGMLVAIVRGSRR